MPGIHVRKIGKFNWLEEKSGFMLTVPGSYWLCHKNKIHKFVLKYNPLNRRTDEFMFENELVKVIRRIIKSNPKQGQKFGTNHLLITYNQISWTRQDKMFAMLKFKSKTGALTAPYASLLTVEVICHHDTQATLAEKRKRRKSFTISSSDCILTKTGDRNYMEEEYSCDSEYTKSPMGIIPSCIHGKTTGHNSSNTESNASGTRFSTQIHDPSLKTSTRTQAEYIKVKDAASLKKRSKNLFTSEEDVLLANNDIIEKEKRAFQSDRQNFTETISNTHDTGDSIDESNADSTNLPYQYLIEKDIESIRSDELHGGSSLQIEKNESIEASTAENCVSEKQLHVGKSEKLRLNSDNEKKFSASSKTSRSSNITDLVMEGLMFTIRQEKDSVAVIEQKTKLEVDEVLENSEEAETKEGEKCLKNSSLLGLENLITKIEHPIQAKANGMNYNNSGLENIVLSTSLCSSHIHNLENNTSMQSTSNWHESNTTEAIPSTSFAHNSDSTGKIAQQNACIEEGLQDIYNSENDMNEEFSADEEFEEDIIPEAMQDGNLLNSLTDSLNDYINSKQVAEESSIPLNSTLNSQNSTLHSSSTPSTSNAIKINSESLNYSNGSDRNLKYSFTNKRESNLPRIVSNEVITVDQIPLALQIALRSKHLMQGTQSTSKNDICKIRCEDQEGQYSASTSKLTVEESTQNTLHDFSSTELSQDCTNKNSVMDHKVHPVEPEKVTQISRRLSCSATSKRRNLESQRLSLNELKRLVPNGLQDITPDFYSDLLQMEKKRSSTEQRCLRQRRRPMNSNKESEVRVEMLKFIRDITMGAKVVVKRLSMKRISAILANNTPITTCLN